jgi:hypothetical protein
MQVRSTIKNYSDQRELLADLGFMEISEEMPVESNKNYAVPTEKLTPEVFSTQENLSGQSDEPELNEDKNNDHEVEVVTSKSKCAEGTVPVSAKSTSILIDTIRHSSRLKEDGTTMMAKAMNKKASAASKGNSSSSNSITSSSNHVELIVRACGINLGSDESSRLANISLIQAREEAVEALSKARNKILLSSETTQQQTLSSNRNGDTAVEVPRLQQANQLEVDKSLKDILSLSVINEDTILEC